MLRQALQSLLQFLIVFFTGVATYKWGELTAENIWQPFVQGVLAALGIWGASLVPPKEVK